METLKTTVFPFVCKYCKVQKRFENKFFLYAYKDGLLALCSLCENPIASITEKHFEKMMDLIPNRENLTNLSEALKVYFNKTSNKKEIH